jgi:hypothetical protein
LTSSDGEGKGESVIDLSGLTAEARPIVQQVAPVYLNHSAPWFIGLIVHGSAVKGGIIPNCSDIDFQLYLDRAAFTWQGQLPLELGFAVRRDLEGIPLSPFRYVQCLPQTDEPQENWVGPIPGAYHLVAGRLPVREATAQDLRASARLTLAKLNPAPTFIQSDLFGSGGVLLQRNLRLLCTKVWPILYQVLTLLEEETDPIGIWCLTKEQAMERLPSKTALQETIRAFYRAVWNYYPAEDSLENALAVIESGVAFLGAASSWWRYADGRSQGQQ